MSLKKVSDLAKKFMTKLAQDPFGGMTPHEISNAPLEQVQNQLFGPSPKPVVQPKNSPQLSTVMPDNIVEHSTLPADLKQMLDVGAPGTKGMLRLTLDGNTLRVAYNADRWRRGASELKRILTNAVAPKYKVEDPIGYFNPEWTFNY